MGGTFIHRHATVEFINFVQREDEARPSTLIRGSHGVAAERLMSLPGKTSTLIKISHGSGIPGRGRGFFLLFLPSGIAGQLVKFQACLIRNN